MTKNLRVPDTHTSQRLLTDLRRTRIEMEAFNLKLAEIITELELEAIKNKQKKMEERNRLSIHSQL